MLILYFDYTDTFKYGEHKNGNYANGSYIFYNDGEKLLAVEFAVFLNFLYNLSYYHFASSLSCGITLSSDFIATSI